MKTITPKELKAKIDKGEDFKLIDVREDYEVAVSMIPGAEHVKLDKITTDPSVLEDYQDKPIIFTCRSGGRSGVACGIAEAAGFKDVTNLEGGITGWKAEVDPSLKIYE